MAGTFGLNTMPVRRHRVGPTGRILNWSPQVLNQADVIRAILTQYPNYTNNQVLSRLEAATGKPVSLNWIRQQRKRLGL